MKTYFKFNCLYCGQHMECEPEHSGRQIKCPSCEHKMVIPPAPEQAVGGLGSTLPVTQDPTSNTFWSETAIIDAIRDANVKGIDPAVHLAQKKNARNPT